MQLTLSLEIPQLKKLIGYGDKILLIGSCFTEHIADRLEQHKFRILSNPHGILFNPLSVADSLQSYIEGKQYQADDLFELNELWNSWEHHTRFSNINKHDALSGINQSQQTASGFIKEANYVIITLGSAFQYYLRDTGRYVANNHRAPAQWFQKRLLSTEAIIQSMEVTLGKLQTINPDSYILFTISPVRHIRDGVIDNNRSKARLIEAVHEICARFGNTFYFPAYELVIDILRDYRFYDIDYVHPNFMATNFVWEQFSKSCISSEAKLLMQQIKEIVTAAAHRPRFSETKAHNIFKEKYMEKTMNLNSLYPYLDFSKEISYFSQH